LFLAERTGEHSPERKVAMKQTDGPIQIYKAFTLEMIRIGSSRSSIPSAMSLDAESSDFSCIVYSIETAAKRRIADFLREKSSGSSAKRCTPGDQLNVIC
jgi:hypothetical protein